MESQINQKSQASKSNDIIGSYLSLITKAESRYEGTLFEVDKQNKTMSLKNVKNYGTEGRRNGENEVPKSEQIIGQVKFRVDLIKTFKIIDKPMDSSNESKDANVDPAIVEAKNNEGEQQKNETPYPSNQKQILDKKYQNNCQIEKSENQFQRKPINSKMQEKKHTFDQEDKKFAKQEFDFSKRQLEKNDNNQNSDDQNLIEGQEEPKQKAKYDKNDFFDQLTNSTLEPRPQTSRGRGGYRGGRGGYQGSGRGGNNPESFRGGRDRNFQHGQDYKSKGNWDGSGFEFRNKGESSFYQSQRNNYQKKELYSQKLQDPNDPNYSQDDFSKKDSFYDLKKKQDDRPQQRDQYQNLDQNGSYRGRGGFRGGRGRGQLNNDGKQKDEETFGSYSSNNFQFNHQKEGRGGRNQNNNSNFDNKYAKNQIQEDAQKRQNSKSEKY